jgi:uncharacterized protein (TIGR00369 family)
MSEYTPLSLQQINSAMEHMAFNHFMGMRVTEVFDDGLTIECDVTPHHFNGDGVVHGGVTATLADSAMGVALVRHFGGKIRAATVEMKINYFRPILGTKISARCKLVRMGSKICVGTVDIYDDAANHAGLALLTYMIIGPRG